MTDHADFDAIILGGGFYGCCIALLLARRFSRIAIIEREPALLGRASTRNQARIHGGYHYPRSILTAARSHANLPRFIADFGPAIADDFTQLYAIARHGSKINAGQFHNFFRKLGAPIEPAPPPLQKLFNPAFIEQVFVTREAAFDAAKLTALLRQRLAGAGIDVMLNTATRSVAAAPGGIAVVTPAATITAPLVFNCLYAGINTLMKNSALPLLPLRHEVTEMALVEPGPFAGLGLTIMDGPFCSLMPYPAANAYTLSHVRYTPRQAWNDADAWQDGYAALDALPAVSAFPAMRRDAARYIPLAAELRATGSIREIKTTLTRNLHDDGRPILFREEPSLPDFFTVMGGKIDNIYDILDLIAETRPALGLSNSAALFA